MEAISPEIAWWRVVLWWEARRIPYNLALLVIGCATVFLCIFLIEPTLPADDEGIEPFLGVILYGIAANLCYTLGWVIELWLRKENRLNVVSSRRWMFRTGFIGSCLLTAAPVLVALVVRAIWTLKH